MPFSMKFNKEQLQGRPPAPPGWYTIQFKHFKPAVAGDQKDSVSLNPEFSIVGNGSEEGKKVFASLNSKAGWILFDFVHAFGLPMEEIQDGNQGTEAASYTIPGVFENADKFPDDPKQWKYLGPLANKVIEVELAITEYQGRQRNEIRQFRCAVPDCHEKHSTNLISSSK